jgi:hypothetical protein
MLSIYDLLYGYHTRNASNNSAACIYAWFAASVEGVTKRAARKAPGRCSIPFDRLRRTQFDMIIGA